MEETKRMDLRQVDDLVNKPQGSNGTVEKENNPADAATALQLFYFFKIPIRSIPGTQNSPGIKGIKIQSFLYLKESLLVFFETHIRFQLPFSFSFSSSGIEGWGHCKDAIQMLCVENVAGAPIADVLGPEATMGRSSDRYIGSIDFTSMLLWSLENWEKAGSPKEGRDGSGEETSISSLLPMPEQNCEEAGSPTEGRDGSGEETGRNSLLSMLEQNPQIVRGIGEILPLGTILTCSPRRYPFSCFANASKTSAACCACHGET
ncbi:hypothetical protein SLEP1_g50180 [Rubroshorea leprosula]|uniref:Uncharacterized protein n=1 Tax=Rubroshorea leprosula TaxID=152421 RepID=A0AAV5M1H7_9ROSI|nr:hypothetical protein SLEP1_g50180 [Rubroshorea leprosula]